MTAPATWLSTHVGAISNGRHAAGTAAAHVRYVLRDGAAVSFSSTLPADGLNGARAAWVRFVSEAEAGERSNGRIIIRSPFSFSSALSPDEMDEALGRIVRRVSELGGDGHRVAVLGARHKGEDNPHGHLVIRPVGPDGRKVPLFAARFPNRTFPEVLREIIEEEQNRLLSARGLPLIDARSYRDQARGQVATIHEGWSGGTKPTARRAFNERVRSLEEAKVLRSSALSADLLTAFSAGGLPAALSAAKSAGLRLRVGNTRSGPRVYISPADGGLGLRADRLLGLDDKALRPLSAALSEDRSARKSRRAAETRLADLVRSHSPATLAEAGVFAFTSKKNGKRFFLLRDPAAPEGEASEPIFLSADRYGLADLHSAALSHQADRRGWRSLIYFFRRFIGPLGVALQWLDDIGRIVPAGHADPLRAALEQEAEPLRRERVRQRGRGR